MKTAIFATALAITSTAASAEGLALAFAGNAEYAVEAETFETNLGAVIGVMPSLTFAPSVTFAGNSDNFEFTGVEVGATYNLTSNFDLYGVVEADKDFNHSETTIGVAFSF